MKNNNNMTPELLEQQIYAQHTNAMRCSIAYFDYDPETYTLQTEASRFPEWFNAQRVIDRGYIAIFNPVTGREVQFEYINAHMGLRDRLVFRSVGPTRDTDDGSPNYLRVVITY